MLFNSGNIYLSQYFVRVIQRIMFPEKDHVRRKPVSVYYHCVSDSLLPHLKYLYGYKNVQQFTCDLEVFTKAFRPVTLDEFIKHSTSYDASGPAPIFITFDDGLREIHDIIAPVLLRMGVPATFFVTRDFIDNRFLCYHHRASLILDKMDYIGKNSSIAIERDLRKKLGLSFHLSIDVRTDILRAAFINRPLIDALAVYLELDFDSFLRDSQPYLTTAQLLKLSQFGFGLGGHGIDHSPYFKMPLSEQLRQTEESVAHLKERFNLKYGVFSFPLGDLGVSKIFFDSLRSRALIDMCFGIRGFVRDQEQILHHRLSMDRPTLRADGALIYHSLRALGRLVLKKNFVRRN